jgi:hypothetical protein
VQLFPDAYYSERPPDFLIVGLQKSGTYWLTNLLNSHPEITCFPLRPGEEVSEVHFFDGFCAIDKDPVMFQKIFFMHKGFFSDLVPLAKKLDRQELLNKFQHRYNAYVQRQKRPNSRIVGEKTPEYIFHLELIDQLYPGIKKLCILRDHCDRIVSFHYHQKRKGRWNHAFIEDWEVEAYCNRIKQEYQALLAYRGSIQLLTYEQLSTNPESVLKTVLTYLGVSAKKDLISEMVERARFERLTGRVQGNSDPTSHFRKGIVGEGKRELTPAQRRLVHQKLDSLTRQVIKKYSIDLNGYRDPIKPFYNHIREKP